jgi:Flp pilus assembly protein TadD
MTCIFRPFCRSRGTILFVLCYWSAGLSLAVEQPEKSQNQALQFENDGKNALMLGNFALAVEDFRSALKLNPDSAEAHSGLGIALLETGNLAEAVAELQKAIKLKPNSWEARYWLAQTFILRGPAASVSGPPHRRR